jgi:WD40 repeat protein
MIGHTNEVTSVAFNPDASALVSASVDGTARVWAITGRPTSVLAGHGATVVDATFSPDGNSVATAGEDGTARLWDPGSEPDLRPISSRRVIDVALTGDGRRFVTAGDGLVLWNTSPLHAIRSLSAAGTRLAAISSDGARVAALFAHNRVAVFDTRSGAALKRVSALGPITAIGFDQANRMLAAAGSSIAIWNGRRLSKVQEITTVDAFAASADGTLIATAGADGDVRLRDGSTWTLRRTLRGHKAAVNSVQFSADGKLLISAGQDGDVRVWNVATGRTERTLHWHSGPVADAAISPDGRWVVTAGPVTVGIGLAKGLELFRPGAYLRGPMRPLTAVGFGGPNGRVVVAAGKDGKLRTFTCDLCGDIHDLIALARRRLGS